MDAPAPPTGSPSPYDEDALHAADATSALIISIDRGRAIVACRRNKRGPASNGLCCDPGGLLPFSVSIGCPRRVDSGNIVGTRGASRRKIAFYTRSNRYGMRVTPVSWTVSLLLYQCSSLRRLRWILSKPTSLGCDYP